jgi:methylenetetrahydrofolate--tRNA-(uracil-5-)-methyltransferase
MRPVGLSDPATGKRAWAVLQLRQENSAGTVLGLVGFQTRLQWPEQARVFRMIPGLEGAEFVRYGVMHRNTYIDSSHLLGPDLSAHKRKTLFFAGQLTGVEGYMESAAAGLVAGINAVRTYVGQPGLVFPPETMIGALLQFITTPAEDFQPMNANFGLLPPLPQPIKDKKQRYAAYGERALASLQREVLPLIGESSC